MFLSEYSYDDIMRTYNICPFIHLSNIYRILVMWRLQSENDGLCSQGVCNQLTNQTQAKQTNKNPITLSDTY